MTEIVKNATMRNPAFWECLAMTIALLLGGFFTPPRAKIDGSILTACGILFAFATLETVHHAIRKGVDARVRHGQTELTVGDLDNGKEDNYETDH